MTALPPMAVLPRARLHEGRSVLLHVAVAPLLASLHLVTSITFCVGALRGEAPRILTLAAAANLVAAYFSSKLPSDRQPGTAQVWHCRAASVCTLVSWGCHLLVHWGWGSCNPCMGEIAFKAFKRTNGGLTYGHLAEALVSCPQQIYAWLFLPPWVVAGLLSIHMRIIYRSLEREGIQPSLPWTVLWFITHAAVPYLHLLYMRRVLARRQASTQSKQAVKPHHSRLALKDQELPIAKPVDGVLLAALRRKLEAQGVSDTHDAGGRQLQPGQQQQHDRRPVLQQTKHRRLGSANAIHSLLAAQRMVQQLQAGQQYRSRLAQAQVIIKLNDSEPEQLAPDVVTSSNRVIGRLDLLVSRACARRGCTLLVFDLISTCDSSTSHKQGIGIDSSAVQEWLGALLAPDAPICDSALAHIVISSRQFGARWKREDSCWAVSAPPASPTAPGPLALLYVDNAVARLPPAVGGNTTPYITSSYHRVSVLLRVQQPATSISFLGSNAQVAAPADSTGGLGASRAVQLHCTARGSWGASLPVVVAGVEVSAEGDGCSGVQMVHASAVAATTHDDAGASQSSPGTAFTVEPATYTVAEAVPGSTLIALTLDVDLSTAPHAGAVQLELWQGHTVAVSVPLLLLPSLSPLHATGPDPLAEELQQSLSEHSWEQEGAKAAAVNEHSPSGPAAFLTDLGQLLSAAECITALEARGRHGSGAKTGPGSWGGIVISTAHQLSSNPSLLSSLLVLSEGLLEYVEGEGLEATAQLIQSLRDTVHKRLGELQGVGSREPGSDAIQAHEYSTAGYSHTSQQAAPKCPSLPDPAKPSASRSSHSIPSAASLSSPPTHKPTRSMVPQPSHQPGYTEAVHAVLSGFQPRAMEHAYGVWMAAQVRSLVRTWSTMFLVWVVICCLRSAQGGGLPELVAHLPFNLLLGSPYVASAIAAARGWHRWMEPLLVMHAVMRAVACWSAYWGLIAWPPSYSLLVRMRVDAWGHMLLHVPCEPMRLPWLLFSSGLHAVGVTAIALVCQSNVWVLRVTLPTVGGVGIGMALDMTRRMAFLRQQASAPGGCARAALSCQQKKEK